MENSRPLLAQAAGEIVDPEQLWSAGNIPIILSCSEDDIACSVVDYRPVAMLASRYSYLHLVANEVVAFFMSQVAAERVTDVWFDCGDGLPLKSTLPIGVLFDLHSNGKSPPWKISVHFQGLIQPEGTIRCSSPAMTEKHFSHSLKQALQLIHGNTRLFNSLSAEGNDQLLRGVRFGCYSDYAEIAFQFKASTETIRTVPIKFMLASSGHSIQQSVSAFQRPNDRESRTTLEQAIPISARLQWERHGPIVAKVHGIAIPLGAPVFDLWDQFHHADLFLYVTLL